MHEAMHQPVNRSSVMATRTNITHKSARPDLAHEDAHGLMPPWLAAPVPALFATGYTLWCGRVLSTFRAASE